MQGEKSLVDISVIIPTKNRTESLVRTVKSVVTQDVQWEIEVIIVDQSPSPVSEKKVKNNSCKKWEHVEIKIIHKPELSGLTAARNEGLKWAKGKYIQFMDDDAVLEKKYFSGIIPVFNNSEVGAASGRIIEPRSRFHPLAKYSQRIFFRGEFRQIREEWYHQKYPMTVETNVLPGVAIYRREVFEEFLFDEKLTGSSTGEDVELSFRVGKKYKFILTPRPKIRHHPFSLRNRDLRVQESQKVIFYKYHFKKNLTKDIKTKINLFVLLAGFLALNIILLKPKRLLGWLEGLLKKSPAQ